MNLIGILLVALWAVPILVSMGCDRDHVSTLGGVMLSNVALFGTMWIISKLSLPSSIWWAVLFVPTFATIYYGIWCMSSDRFRRLVQDVFKLSQNRLALPTTGKTRIRMDVKEVQQQRKA